MVKLVRSANAPMASRPFVPTAFEGSPGPSFKRLRRPTPLPSMSWAGGFGRYIERLNWLFGGR